MRRNTLSLRKQLLKEYMRITYEYESLAMFLHVFLGEQDLREH